MPKLAIGMLTNKPISQVRSTYGFTLVELMVVLIILSITASIAITSFGDFGQSQKIQSQAIRLKNTLQLIRYHAVLENMPYKIELSDLGYEVFKYNHSQDKKWQRVNAQHSISLQSKAFYPQTHIQIFKPSRKTNWQEKPVENQHASIYIQPSGEISAFKLIFFKKNQKTPLVALESSLQGGLLVKS